jgi:hypothetical protein
MSEQTMGSGTGAGADTITDTDTDTMHTGPDTDASDVAEGNDQDSGQQAGPDSKLKGENKRLRQDRGRWQASASAAWQMVAESVLATETNVADPAALLARLKPVHEYVAEDNSLMRDELVADAAEFMKAIKPRGRRDPDQGKGNGRTDDTSFGSVMRQGMTGA